MFAPLLVLTVVWMGVEVHYSSYLSDDWSAKMILIRWLGAFPTAYWLAELCRHEKCRRMVLYGLLAGVVVDIGLVLQDYLLFELTGQTTAVATVDRPVVVWINGEYRAEGIFGHPNAATVATLLCVPLIIGLIDEKLLPKFWILLALAAIVGVFHMTKTRSASMAALLLVLLWFAFNFRSRVAFWIGMTFVLCISVYSVVAAFSDRIMPPLPIELDATFMQRFNNLDNMVGNASDRVLTTLTSFDLAIHNPIGMGSTYENKLRELTGFSATHNGFVQLALLAGLPLATVVFVTMVKAAARIARPRRQTEGWLAAYVVMVFFFENLFFVPFMSAIVLWLMLPPTEREN
jgi:O-antigen ligase